MKTRKDFRNHDEWKGFVRESVPEQDIPYTLASGLTDMYRQFYKLRSQTFPARFLVEIERISALSEPARTQALEALNDSIMADMVRFLLTAASGTSGGVDDEYPVTPRETIDQLLNHLRGNNPYFALWQHYKHGVAEHAGPADWRNYLVDAMGVDDEREIEFAQLVAELGICLDLYHQREKPLPKHFYFQIWFLYRTHGVERNVMTRALVQELAEGLEPCASA